MTRLKQLLDFYINSSIHVAFACYALVKLTQVVFNISVNENVANFAFFGTIVAYNFVKYHTLIVKLKLQISTELKGIVVLSFFSFLFALFYFLQLQLITQINGVGFVLFTFLYTLPFFQTKKMLEIGLVLKFILFHCVGLELPCFYH